MSLCGLVVCVCVGGGIEKEKLKERQGNNTVLNR